MNFSTSSKSKSKPEVSSHSSLSSTQPHQDLKYKFQPQLHLKQIFNKVLHFHFPLHFHLHLKQVFNKVLNMFVLHLHLHLSQVICFVIFYIYFVFCFILCILYIYIYILLYIRFCIYQFDFIFIFRNI